MSHENIIKLNLGCGYQYPEEWINVDYSMGARFSRLPFFRLVNKKLHLFRMEWDDNIFIHNLTTPFPWSDSSVDVVYSSHTLEHMTRQQGEEFLKQSYRVLKPGGIIRIVIPDLLSIVNRYIEGELLAENFVEDLGVMYLETGNRLKDKLSPFVQYPHKCMYDSAALERCMTSVGFKVASRKPFDSEIVDISDIEMESRTCDAVIVEGIKA
jgi:predicted SAM-dependent methyltransferase